MNITEHEMRGLLAGKCLPADILVGESLAAYLVRKFGAMQQRLDALAADKLSTSDRTERRIAACVNAFDGIPTDRIEGKNLGEILAGEVRLNGAGPRADGGFGFEFSGGVCQLMAEAYAEQFRQSGAINYLELLFHHSDIGPLTITMQRVEGLTPAQKLAQAEAQRDALAAENAALKDGINRIAGAYTAEEPASFEIERARHIETPATDAYLNAIRAEGVIMFATKQLAAAGDLESTITMERLMLDAEEFAGQLSAGKDGD